MAQKVGLKKDFYEYAMRYLDNAGQHMPSSRLDLENKRETEVNFLNQKFIDAGKSSNIPTPFSEGLTSLIKGAEESYKK